MPCIILAAEEVAEPDAHPAEAASDRPWANTDGSSMSKMPEFDDAPEDEIIAELYFHIIFWTRKLRPALSAKMLANARQVMDQALFTVDGEALAAGGTENHLHVLARLSPDHSSQKSLDALRRRSAAWVAEACGVRDFSWSENEVAVTISPDDLKAAADFIDSQESHHEIVSFQCELKAIFDEHGFHYEERELWG
jgi:putative transposase